MGNEVYYSSDDLAEENKVSNRIIGEVTSEFIKVITTFAAKKGVRRQFTYDEARAVKYVFDNEDRITRSGAVKEVLRLFYRIK